MNQQSQQSLWHETVEDALRDVVGVLGGPKKVAPALWGQTKTNAATYLNHCLDPERAEKFSLAEVLWILRKGAEAGCHIGMAFLAEHCGYAPPQPVKKEDEKAELQRQYIESVKALGVLTKRLEQIG